MLSLSRSRIAPSILRLRLHRGVHAHSSPPPPAAPPPPPPPRELSEGEQTIHAKLTDKFTPSELLVQDVSGGCGTFYAITIASQAFKGLPTVKQHQLVTKVLKQEIEGIHGLQIKTIPQ